MNKRGGSFGRMDFRSRNTALITLAVSAGASVAILVVAGDAPWAALAIGPMSIGADASFWLLQARNR